MNGNGQEDDVAGALERLLAWPEIARSPQLGRFLSYIVERRLNGDTQSIKAYSIAVDVFGRPPDFDPQADPIVRVQARRLRALLEQYYQGPGRGETLRINLPVGRYIPEFIATSGDGDAETGAEQAAGAHDIVAPLPPAGRGHITVSWLALAVLTLGAAALAYALSTWGERQESISRSAGLLGPPQVSVLEFQNLTGAAADAALTAGLAVELVSDLEQFETVLVRYGGEGVAGGEDAAAADFVLSGIVRREAGGLQYSAILTEMATSSVVWNRAITLDAGETARADLLDHVAGQLSTVLGSSRGPLHRRARTLLGEQASIDGGESLYLCRMLFDVYRDRGTPGAGERSAQCYGALGDRAQASGVALAAMASLGAELAMLAPAAAPADDSLALADARIEAAVEVAPMSGFVWEQRARLYEIAGQHEAAEAAYSSSLQLNPASGDAMAARARHLAFMGQLGAAMALAEQAIEGAPNPPPWYLGAPALQALREGNYEAAVEYAAAYADADRELGPLLAVMAGQRLGDQDVVNRYLPRVLEVPSFRSHGVLTQLRRRIGDETLIRDIRVALLSAGVPPSALSDPF